MFWAWEIVWSGELSESTSHFTLSLWKDMARTARRWIGVISTWVLTWSVTYTRGPCLLGNRYCNKKSNSLNTLPRQEMNLACAFKCHETFMILYWPFCHGLLTNKGGIRKRAGTSQTLGIIIGCHTDRESCTKCNTAMYCCCHLEYEILSVFPSRLINDCLFRCHFDVFVPCQCSHWSISSQKNWGEEWVRI